MKTNFLKIIFAIAALSWAANYGKAFQNLGFESGTSIPIPGDPYGRVQFAPAMPGWTGYTGSNQETNLLNNSIFLGTAGIGRHDAGSTYSPPIQGNYSVLLQAGSNPNTTIFDHVPATIAQTGMVPASSLSVRLLIGTYGTDFQVNFAGVNIPMFELGTSPNYRVFGGDITAFAGQTGELRLSALAVPFNPPNNWIYLDGITFSNLPIPEPSTVSLFALGAVLLSCRRRKKSKLAMP